VVQLLLLHENCIWVTVFVSLPKSVSVVEALVVYVAHALILIVHVGLVVSSMIESVILPVRLFHASLNCIYTVLVPSVLINVHHVLLTRFTQLLQDPVPLLENHIWTGPQLSVQVIFVNVTLVPLT